jgi:hypothetical protein
MMELGYWVRGERQEIFFCGVCRNVSSDYHNTATPSLLPFTVRTHPLILLSVYLESNLFTVSVFPN